MSVSSPAMRLLSACAAVAVLVFSAGCASPTGNIAAARPPSPPEPAGAYLFAHFTGESPRGEQIYFPVSEDGLRWTDLNGSDPVLVSTLGDKGVRDPSIIRSTKLDDPLGFQVLPSDAYSLGASKKRHGGILNITPSELSALRAKCPGRPWTRRRPVSSP